LGSVTIMTDTANLDTAPLDESLVELGFEQHRAELTAYCYRMLGSAFEADDAVQETLVRAWRGFDRFEGRAAVRSWLYRIASNVCFDMLKGRKRRALPIDMMAVGRADGPVPIPTSEKMWVGPVPDRRVIGSGGDPADEAETRDSVRLAFVAALQNLPPRQRAVLILREVLKWKAAEVAELLDTTVVSVNSALQRARATLAERDVSLGAAAGRVDPAQEALLARYVDAFERFDVESLVKLLREDATMSMPPYPMWLQGASELGVWLNGPGSACRGSRLAAVEVNGVRGFAQWRVSPGGGFHAWAIHVLRLSGGQIAGIDFFVDANLFPLFGLPIRIDS
jgi:RNA polymerase sigma-70 factor, ECF subfamily